MPRWLNIVYVCSDCLPRGKRSLIGARAKRIEQTNSTHSKPGLVLSRTRYSDWARRHTKFTRTLVKVELDFDLFHIKDLYISSNPIQLRQKRSTTLGFLGNPHTPVLSQNSERPRGSKKASKANQAFQQPHQKVRIALLVFQ